MFMFSVFFFNDTATSEIYTLSLHDALPISRGGATSRFGRRRDSLWVTGDMRARPFVPRDRYLARRRSEEHTSELQSRGHLVCRLLLEKKKKKKIQIITKISKAHQKPQPQLT